MAKIEHQFMITVTYDGDSVDEWDIQDHLQKLDGVYSVDIEPHGQGREVGECE